MKLDNNTVLHVVDLRTKFSSACFLFRKSGEDDWHKLIHSCSSIYTDYSGIAKVNQGSIFNYVKFRATDRSLGIHFRISVEESHNFLGATGTYRGQQRRMYLKIRYRYPKFTVYPKLALDIKVVNDIMDSDSLVSSLLACTALPRFLFVSSPVLPQREILNALCMVGRDWNNCLSTKAWESLCSCFLFLISISLQLGIKYWYARNMKPQIWPDSS